MCVFSRTITEEIGTDILFTLKIIEISKRMEGSQGGSERKEVSDSLYGSDTNSCIFHTECMINSSNLLSNCEKLGFSPLYSFLGEFLDDCFCLDSLKQTQGQD